MGDNIVTNDWFYTGAPGPCQDSIELARARQSQLTKPPGSLGQLELLAIQLAGLQATETPQIEYSHIHIFAADHGICAEGVSAFPQVVTAEMIKNFASGGAAISVLAKEQKVPLQIHNLGTVVELPELSGVSQYHLSSRTDNFARMPAMSEKHLACALNVGAQAVEQSHRQGMQLFIGGEMGIGNTSSASALAAAYLGRSANQLCGPGTGLETQQVTHKAEIINQALRLHLQDQPSSLEILRRLGGFEIAALVGAYIRAAQLGVAILVDGFICSAAALVAVQINPSVRPWLLLSHQSAEPGHSYIANALELEPILNLAMRLGEGSGAAMALPILKLSCALHNKMATFDSAGVSTGD